jgi:probable HAF family extracellular repeat protein
MFTILLRFSFVVCLCVLLSTQLIAQTVNLGYWEQVAESPFLGRAVPSVCINGNVAVVGLFDLAVAFVYVKSPGGQIQIVRLTPSDGNASFGYSVSISGDTIIVTGPTPNNNPGKAYVFVKPPTGWTDMTETAQLTSSDGFSEDGFGASVSVSADIAVVGANADNGTTAAYVFAKPPGGWTSMTQTAKLLPSDSNGFDEFGASSSISGGSIVIGAYLKKKRGAAYIFVEPKTGWRDMTQTAELIGSGGSYFGWSLAFIGDTIAVGAPRIGGQIPGTVDVFVKPPSGWQNTSTPDAILTASDGQGKNLLGYSVSASGNTIMAGAPNARWIGTPGPGVVYTFIKRPSGWVTGTESSSFVASDGEPGDSFGSSVSVSGAAAVVAGGGHMYAFKYIANAGFTWFAWPENGTFTTATGVNNVGQIVGGSDEGAFLDTNGVFTLISYPGNSQTAASGVNDGSEVVGTYDAVGNLQGFSEQNGVFTTIDHPGATNTAVSAVNNAGDIVGYYFDDNYGPYHGFLYSGGVFSEIDVPGALRTFVTGINNAGQIAGYYCVDPCQVTTGFKFSQGTYKDVKYPNAASTSIHGINDWGDLVGNWYGLTGQGGDFVFWNSSQQFQGFNLRGIGLSTAWGVNSSGEIVGAVSQPNGGEVAFYGHLPGH